MLEWNYIYKSQLIKQSNHYQFRLRNVLLFPYGPSLTWGGCGLSISDSYDAGGRL